MILNVTKCKHITTAPKINGYSYEAKLITNKIISAKERIVNYFKNGLPITVEDVEIELNDVELASRTLNKEIRITGIYNKSGENLNKEGMLGFMVRKNLSSCRPKRLNM